MKAEIFDDRLILEDGVVAALPWPSDHTPTKWVRDVIGQMYRGMDGQYLCLGYYPAWGFWMYCKETDRLTNISERAIGRTYHPIE